MAAVGAEVAGSNLLSSGLVVSVVLLFLFIFLVALCSECRKRSFELQAPQVDRNPSTLIKVVKLEEVKENPMIDEIQRDEKELRPKEDSAVVFSSSQLHHAELEAVRDVAPEGEPSVTFTPWRSHLMAPQSNAVNSSYPTGSAHVYDVIERGRGNSSNAEQVAHPVVTTDKNLVYAQIKKLPLNNSAVHTPEE